MEKPKNQLYLIIHGHFYQPPREDPYTDMIDKQNSAHPYHDWNERINKECYSANASSRVLDETGKIISIINNYEYISFNFGPTLLNWLERNDKKTYEKIIEADYKSRERNGGHGNAIAQAYNHMILPLADDRDKYTQIIWGIKDFRKRFGRDPEGMWLPETAVNDRVLQVLIDNGIKFTILSPHQAEAIRPLDGSSGWIDVSHGEIDYSQPYVSKQPNGEIYLFFYNHVISTAVSFEHLCRSSENFINVILRNNNPHKDIWMIPIATDGEVYGHHEPFADMCLAALIYKNNKENLFKMVNFAYYLDIVKPKYEVRLKKGNNNLGTSWSCVHGVDRWYRDCGCTTYSQPGWNQKWRTPLRNAMDYLRDNFFIVFEREGNKYFKNVWEARNDYVEVIMAKNSGYNEEYEKVRDEFLRKHIKEEWWTKEKVVEEDREINWKTEALRFMEASANAMYMYTSCGWFFADISGIETVQIMRYASRVLDLMQPYFSPEVKEKFLSILGLAESNIKEYKDGRWIFENWIEKTKFSEQHVVNQFVAVTKILNAQKPKDKLYFYDICLKEEKEMEKDGWNIYKGIAKLCNYLLDEQKEFVFYMFINKKTGKYKNYIKQIWDPLFVEYIDKLLELGTFPKVFLSLSEWFTKIFTLDDIKYEYRQHILNKLFEEKFKSLHIVREDIDEYLQLVEYYFALGVPIPEYEKPLIATIFMDYLHKKIKDILENEENITKLVRIINISKKAQISIPLEIVSSTVEGKLWENLEKLKTTNINELDEKVIDVIIKVVDFINTVALPLPNRRDLEDFMYSYLQKEFMEMITKVSDKAELKSNIHKLVKVLDIAEKLNISVWKYRRLLANI